MSGVPDLMDYFENPVLTSTGEERIIAWYNTVFRDDDGRITTTLSQGVDIPSVKKLKRRTKSV